jgi:hypothetical protein
MPTGREAKAHAARNGISLTRLIENDLREVLARRRPVRVRERVILPTYRGGGLQPGVDLEDTAALLDLMDGSGC